MQQPFARHLSISMTKDGLLAVVEPRYVKLSTVSSKILSMLIVVGTCMSWLMMLVFLMLNVSSNSLQARANLLINCHNWSSVWETRTVLSTK